MSTTPAPSDAAIEELIRSLFVDRDFPSSKPGVASYWLTADELRLVMSRLATPAQQTQSDAVAGAVEAEREACALAALSRRLPSKEVSLDGRTYSDAIVACVKAIRARGDTPPQQATPSAAASIKPDVQGEAVSRADFDARTADLTRAKNLLVRLYDKHPAARAQIEASTGKWFVWGVDRGAALKEAPGGGQ